MKLSVIITAHNKGHYLNLMLQRLRAGLPEAQFVLVDDGSTDNTGDVMKRYADTFIRTEDIWETRANNAALRETTGDYIAIIQDDDLIVATDWFPLCAGAMKDLKLGILSGRGTGHWYFKSDGHTAVDQSPRALTAHDDTLVVQAKPFGSGGIRLDAFIRDKAVSTSATFSCGIYRCETTIRSPFIISRALIDSIGLLDEAYAPLVYDDHDYCMRAAKAGFSAAFTIVPQKVRFGGGSHWLYESGKDRFIHDATAKNQRLFGERYGASFPPYDSHMAINRLGSLSFTPDTALLTAMHTVSLQKNG